MKRFFFICVALIAFIATNASGTSSYQPNDQLQTFTVMQTDNQITMPAINVVDFAFTAPAVQVQPLLQAGSQEMTDKYVLPAYCDPDYGLCNRLNGLKLASNYQSNRYIYNIKYNDVGSINKGKLPIYPVQLE